jgi:hypothetical protein
MNDKIRGYFANHHPEWLINVSPSAFTDDERTKLARKLLQDINGSKTYLVDQERLNLRRLSRLLTPAVIADVTVQRTSAEPYEVANALILLGILRESGIAPQALRLVTAYRSESTLRYSAIIALINTGENTVINDLIAFADQTDPYYISIIDAIGSLCTPADFPSVLPLLESTNAGLSSAYYHFREFNTREALIAAIAYLIGNPRSLDGHDLDSYLEPIIDLIPTHWDEEIGTNIGVLLANAERQQLFLQREKLPTAIIKHVAAIDHEALVIPAMVQSLAADGTRLRHTCHLIAPLISVRAAQWINEHAPQYGQDVFPWLRLGQHVTCSTRDHPMLYVRMRKQSLRRSRKNRDERELQPRQEQSISTLCRPAAISTVSSAPPNDFRRNTGRTSRPSNATGSHKQ